MITRKQEKKIFIGILGYLALIAAICLLATKSSQPQPVPIVGLEFPNDVPLTSRVDSVDLRLDSKGMTSLVTQTTWPSSK